MTTGLMARAGRLEAFSPARRSFRRELQVHFSLVIRFLRFDGVIDVQQAPNSAANCGWVTNAWLVP